VDFETLVQPMIKYFEAGRREEFERLKECLACHTGSEYAENRILVSDSLEVLIEAAIDHTTLSIESIQNAVAIEMKRELPGRQYPDIVSFIEQFFFDEGN